MQDNSESSSPRDLYVRTALLEQAMLHQEQMHTVHREMTENRIRAAEDQTGRLADRIANLDGQQQSAALWMRDTAHWLAHHQEEVQGISKRQQAHDTLAVRLRYALSAILLLVVVADQMGPEVKAKVLPGIFKALALP